MHKLILLLVGILSSCGVKAQHITRLDTIHSAVVDDDFELYISLPKAYQAADSCRVVYYCDANLKLGKLLRTLLSDEVTSTKFKDCIFVGIGHIGNFHALRRRDFTLPIIKDSDTLALSSQYGQIRHFYTFMTKELMPSIAAQYPIKADEATLIGHSLGGLFVFYCLFQETAPFKHYIAMSPSLWINRYGIYAFDKLGAGFKYKRTLLVSAGAKEKYNHILKGNQAMQFYLTNKAYKQLDFRFVVYKHRSHNSSVQDALREGLLQRE